MRTVLLTCALFAAACGGSDNRPAQDPSTTSTTTTSSTSLTDAPAPATNATMAPSANATGATNSDSALAPTVGQSAGSTNANVQSGSTAAPTYGVTPTAPSTSDANVANNPGAHDQTKNADNTKINDRDRHGGLTPMNQGNSSDETKITATIRRGLMSDKSLSFTAKNVKIITVGTKVTLRGPVNSDQERTAIETHAKQTAGVTDVDNQIEVKK